ncbi:MAG: hypothetical protein H6679_02250 [Epsilonproteobacteria bacterium]|nr:hypothetical protein [Campylobacterota bacterium]
MKRSTVLSLLVILGFGSMVMHKANARTRRGVTAQPMQSRVVTAGTATAEQIEQQQQAMPGAEAARQVQSVVGRAGGRASVGRPTVGGRAVTMPAEGQQVEQAGVDKRQVVTAGTATTGQMVEQQQVDQAGRGRGRSAAPTVGGQQVQPRAPQAQAPSTSGRGVAAARSGGRAGGRRDVSTGSAQINKLPVLQPNMQYKVKDLINMIRTNDQRANFLELTANGSAGVNIDNWMAQQMTPAQVDPSTGQPMTNGDMAVTVKQDPQLIQRLFQEGKLDEQTKSNYMKVMLYFEANIDGVTRRLYLEDPWPGDITRTALGDTNPAAINLQSWAVN